MVTSPRGAPHEYSMALSEAADDPGQFQIWLAATVDGVACRLLLDPGAGRTSVPAAVADGHCRIGGAAGAGVSGGRSVVERVRVDRIDVGPFGAGDVEVDVVPHGSPAPCVLGMDLIGRHRCEFDFGAERLRMDAASPTLGVHADVRPRAAQPHVRVDFERSTSAAVWDTGASTTVVDLGWAIAHPEAVEIGADGPGGVDSTGASVAGRSGRLAACRIGDLAIAATDCAIVDLSRINADLADPLEVILGLPVLRQAVWWWDFPRQQWAARR